MGFENLMQRAEQIRSKAIAQARIEAGIRKSPWESISQQRARMDEIVAVANTIPGSFQPFTRLPDPASFDDGINQLKAALSILSGGQDTADPISNNGRVYPANRTLLKIHGVDADVQGWSGRAAQAFRTNFLEPFPAITHNQFLLVSALKSALEAEQAMWKAARQDISNLADATYNRMDTLHDCDTNAAAVVLTVVASICAVVAAPLSGGTSLGMIVGITAITAAGAVSSAAVDIMGLQPAPKTQITGENVIAVVASMNRNIELLTSKINETERRIQEALANLISQIVQSQSSNSNRSAFCVRRPALAGANRGNVRHGMGYTD
jgi:hypothetical protein